MFFRKQKERNKIISVRHGKKSVPWRKNRKSGGSGFWSRLFFGTAFLAFCGAVIYVLFFSQFLLIKSIVVEGALNVDRKILEEMAREEISGQYIRHLEKSNIIIFNAGKIKENILQRFKIISEVKIKRKFPEKITIIVSEREPSLILSGNGRCFVAEKNGLVFDEADCQGKYLAREDFSVLSNESNKEIIIGENYIDAEYIDFILASRSGIESDLEIPLEKEMRTPSIVSSDIRMKTKEGWNIFLNERLTVEKELEMLQVVLENKISAEQRKNLEYIDLRTENRVYYKFKNSEASNQENKTEPEEKKEEVKSGRKSGY